MAANLSKIIKIENGKASLTPPMLEALGLAPPGGSTPPVTPPVTPFHPTMTAQNAIQGIISQLGYIGSAAQDALKYFCNNANGKPMSAQEIINAAGLTQPANTSAPLLAIVKAALGKAMHVGAVEIAGGDKFKWKGTGGGTAANPPPAPPPANPPPGPGNSPPPVQDQGGVVPPEDLPANPAVKDAAYHGFIAPVESFKIPKTEDGNPADEVVATTVAASILNSALITGEFAPFASKKMAVQTVLSDIASEAKGTPISAQGLSEKLAATLGGSPDAQQLAEKVASIFIKSTMTPMPGMADAYTISSASSAVAICKHGHKCYTMPQDGKCPTCGVKLVPQASSPKGQELIGVGLATYSNPANQSAYKAGMTKVLSTYPELFDGAVVHAMPDALGYSESMVVMQQIGKNGFALKPAALPPGAPPYAHSFQTADAMMEKVAIALAVGGTAPAKLKHKEKIKGFLGLMQSAVIGVAAQGGCMKEANVKGFLAQAGLPSNALQGLIDAGVLVQGASGYTLQPKMIMHPSLLPVSDITLNKPITPDQYEAVQVLALSHLAQYTSTGVQKKIKEFLESSEICKGKAVSRADLIDGLTAAGIGSMSVNGYISKLPVIKVAGAPMHIMAPEMCPPGFSGPYAESVDVAKDAFFAKLAGSTLFNAESGPKKVKIKDAAEKVFTFLQNKGGWSEADQFQLNPLFSGSGVAPKPFYAMLVAAGVLEPVGGGQTPSLQLPCNLYVPGAIKAAGSAAQGQNPPPAAITPAKLQSGAATLQGMLSSWLHTTDEAEKILKELEAACPGLLTSGQAPVVQDKANVTFITSGAFVAFTLDNNIVTLTPALKAALGITTQPPPLPPTNNPVQQQSNPLPPPNPAIPPASVTTGNPAVDHATLKQLPQLFASKGGGQLSGNDLLATLAPAIQQSSTGFVKFQDAKVQALAILDKLAQGGYLNKSVAGSYSLSPIKQISAGPSPLSVEVPPDATVLSTMGWKPDGAGLKVLKALNARGDVGLSMRDAMTAIPDPKPALGVVGEMLESAMEKGLVKRVPGSHPATFLFTNQRPPEQPPSPAQAPTGKCTKGHNTYKTPVPGNCPTCGTPMTSAPEETTGATSEDLMSFDAIPDGKTLVKENSAASLGGMKDKHFVVDPATGNRFVFKPDSDHDGLRCITSEVASKIGQLVLGPKKCIPVKVTRLAPSPTHPQGELGGIQPFLETKGNMSILDLNNLTPDQKEDILGERVYDWLISSHDTKVDNFVVTPDGHILGVDKEQAFKWVGDDKLNLTYKPNHDVPVYNELFKKFAAGMIDLPLDSVLPIIQRIEAIPDDEYLKITEPYYQINKNVYSTNIDQKRAAVLKRKQSMRKDMQKFFDMLVKERGGTGFAFSDGKGV
jgi:hypothetical protein